MNPRVRLVLAMLLPPVTLASLGLVVGQLSRPARATDALAVLAQKTTLPQFDAGYWYQEAALDTETWRKALATCVSLGPGYPNCEAPLAIEKLRATEDMAHELEARIASAEEELAILEEIAATTPEVASEAAALRAERLAMKDGEP